MCKGQIDMTAAWMLCQLTKQKNNRGAANNAARRIKDGGKRHLSDV